MFRGLCNGIDRFAVVPHRQQNGRRWEVTVPKVVVDSLKMPQQITRSCVDGKEAIGVQIVSRAVRSVEVAYSRACRHIEDAALLVEYTARPVVRAPGVAPGVLRPAFVAGLAGTGNCVKSPSQFAGMHVVGAHVAVDRGTHFPRS